MIGGALATVDAPRGRTAEPTRGQNPAWTATAVGALTLLAFVLRWHGLGESLSGDELFAFDDVHGRSLGAMLHYISVNIESSPPLFFICAWVSAHIGDPTEAIRWPSIIAGAATVPVVFLLGARAASRSAGWLAALLFALNPLAIWQGSEGRPYALLMFCSVLSALLLLLALERRRWSPWWAAYALSVAAVAYTHYTGIFVLAIQTAWALWARPARRRELLGATAGAFVLYLPWLPSYHGSFLGVYNALGVHLAPQPIASLFLQAIVGHPAEPDFRWIPGAVATVAFVVVLLAAVIAGAEGLRRRPRWRARLADEGTLVFLLALATPLGLLVYSLSSYNLLLVHNLVASLPFALLSLAMLVLALRRFGWPVAGAAAAVVTAVMAIGAVKTESARGRRVDYRAALAVIEAHSLPGDMISDASIFPVAPGLRQLVPTYFSKPYLVVAADDPAARAGWARASAGARAFVIVAQVGVLRRYVPGPINGYARACQRRVAVPVAPPGCARRRGLWTFPGLQPLVVAEYSGR